MSVRTRFAPSPTGYLHIGGVRTALFNWLLARQAGGQFVLRIDDTDAERNRAEALQPILDGFRWLGLDWDEGPEVGGPYAPYYQSQRNDRYLAAARRLLEAGNAYPDYSTKEELDAARKAAEAAKRPFVFRGAHRDTPADECVRLFDATPAPLRFKVPLGQVAVVEDKICGRVEQRTDLMPDPVILRADGRALYNFATVVDDIDLRITHVVRAKEHLANTYSQVLFYDALGAARPVFAHIPVVNEPNSKKKLSKRDMAKFVTEEVRDNLRLVGWTDEQIDSANDLNPATVAYYRELGYLPAGLVNYLGRLGWSLDGTSEVIPIAEMVEKFSLERVTDASASFDPAKLHWMAGEYMKLLPADDKAAGCLPFLIRAGLVSDPPTERQREILTGVIAAAGERIKLFSDILPYGGPFFRAEPEYAAKSVEKRLKKPGVAELLTAFAAHLEALPEWVVPALDKALHEFATGRGLKPGEVVHPVRVATTGVEVGVGLFDVLAILGRDAALARLRRGAGMAG